MSKKFSKLFVIAATAIGMLTVAGVESTSVTLAGTNNSRGTLVALGDSITFGYNLPDTKGNTVASASAFPSIIGHDDQLQVTDLAVPGWTSGDLLTALQTPNFQQSVAGASVITLDIGSNDLLHLASQMGLMGVAQKDPAAPITLTADQQQQFGLAITQFGKNLTAIVTEMRLKSSAPIVLFNLYDPFPGGTALHNVTEQFQQVQNQMITQLATSQKHAVVADAHTAFDGKQMTLVRVAQSDVHPTIQGQVALAEVGEAVLKPLLPPLPVAPGDSTGSTGSTVPGGTTPVTGLPFVTEELLALALLAGGGVLMAYSRRHAHRK